MSPTRRRQLLIGLAVLVALAGLWDQVWRPLQAQREALRAEAVRARALHDWVAATLPRLRGTSGAAPATVGGAQGAAEAVQGSLRRFNLDDAVTRIEPRDGQVQVSLAAASFDSVVGWVAMLEDELGLRVIALALTRAAASGRVDGTLAVTVGGGDPP